MAGARCPARRTRESFESALARGVHRAGVDEVGPVLAQPDPALGGTLAHREPLAPRTPWGGACGRTGRCAPRDSPRAGSGRSRRCARGEAMYSSTWRTPPWIIRTPVADLAMRRKRRRGSRPRRAAACGACGAASTRPWSRARSKPRRPMPIRSWLPAIAPGVALAQQLARTRPGRRCSRRCRPGTAGAPTPRASRPASAASSASRLRVDVA